MWPVTGTALPCKNAAMQLAIRRGENKALKVSARNLGHGHLG